MEKRQAPPAPPPQITVDTTPEKTVKALEKVSDSAMIAASLASAVEKKMSEEMADHKRIMQSMVEAIKPKPKTITVSVTSFDEEGRPVKYTIEVR